MTGAQCPFPLRVSRSIPFLSVTVCASHETFGLIPPINRGVGTSLPRKLIKSRRFHRTNEWGDSSQLAITLDPDPSALSTIYHALHYVAQITRAPKCMCPTLINHFIEVQIGAKMF